MYFYKHARLRLLYTSLVLVTSLVLLASDSSTATISRDLMLHAKSLNAYGSLDRLSSAPGTNLQGSSRNVVNLSTPLL